MRYSATIVLALLSALGQAACTPTPDEGGPAPVDSGTGPVLIDTSTTADTSVATPPITPSQTTTPVDTPPTGAQQQDSSQQQSGTPQRQEQGAPRVSQAEYEGWRQYSVNCARCHGQDVLPNPVAANLLISLAPGGAMAAPEKFAQVVSEGRPNRGMPAFKSIMTPDQIQAVYAYVKGRADKRIPAGRPAQPTG